MSCHVLLSLCYVIRISVNHVIRMLFIVPCVLSFFGGQVKQRVAEKRGGKEVVGGGEGGVETSTEKTCKVI